MGAIFLYRLWMFEQVARVLSDLMAVFEEFSRITSFPGPGPTPDYIISNQNFCVMISKWTRSSKTRQSLPQARPFTSFTFHRDLQGGRSNTIRWARISTTTWMTITWTPLMIVRWLFSCNFNAWYRSLFKLYFKSIYMNFPVKFSKDCIRNTKHTKCNSSPKMNCFNLWAPESYCQCTITTDRSRGDIWQQMFTGTSVHSKWLVLLFISSWSRFSVTWNLKQWVGARKPFGLSWV